MSGLTTKIGKVTVPVKTRHATLVKFTGGAGGKHEAGDFAFWTAVLKKPIWAEPKDGWPRGGKKKKITKIFGRAYVSLGAGDRFDRMRAEAKELKGRPDGRIYHRMFHEFMKQGHNVAYVRPATNREVRGWMATHLSDAKYAVGTAYYRPWWKFWR